MDDDISILFLRAVQAAREKYPMKSDVEWFAYASSLVYAVTGQAVGNIGPTVREHAARRICPPYRSFESARDILLAEDGPIFGPLTPVHRKCWVEENCFNDKPADVGELSEQEK
ncbi:MAG: hypothetical protein IPL87_00350 [Candidatus Moraniibacteriota bacterium]|nr:MAG: hypothetical protein IPL87_00350 [Candidatus Moranbacteria bacterium]